VRLVVALGGNALLRRGERPEPEIQRRRVREAVAALSRRVRGNDLLVTHGNGPQIGLLALQADAYRGGPAVPLDVLGAESEGMIGYLLAQELENALPGREVVTLLTRVEVNAEDPAFRNPTKPIGPVYSVDEGERLARERAWTMVRDGVGVRRVVPSPTPRRILEMGVIRRLIDAHVVVVCGGGGGIPVVVGPGGALEGVEAVVDKDSSAALLAEGVDADGLVLLTDTPAVYERFGSPGQQLIPIATPEELGRQAFEAGTMGPKVEAACRFVERSGGWAAIGALQEADAVVAGTAGTRIQASSPPSAESDPEGRLSRSADARPSGSSPGTRRAEARSRDANAGRPSPKTEYAPPSRGATRVARDEGRRGRPRLPQQRRPGRSARRPPLPSPRGSPVRIARRLPRTPPAGRKRP
jgi:carbamate kinase